MPKRRSPGEGSITRRKDGAWQGSITIGYDTNGKQRRRYASGRTQAEVRNKLHDLKTQHRAGKLPIQDIPFADYADTWLREKARQVKPRTIESYRYTMHHYLVPRLGAHLLSKLSTLILQTTLGAIADDVSPNTSNACRSLLYAALDQAVRWGLIPTNPTQHVPRLRHTKGDMQLWTAQQARQFLIAAKEHRLYALFYLTVTTGLRIGELLALQWSDLQDDRLHVRRTLTKHAGRHHLSSAKTARAQRVVTLAGDALEALLHHRQRQHAERENAGPGWEHPDHIFVTEIGTYLDHSNVRRVWNAIEQRAGVPHARLHDARHLHVSLLVKHGIDARTIADRIGHTNAAFTLKQYAHVFDEQRAAAAVPLDDLLND